MKREFANFSVMELFGCMVEKKYLPEKKLIVAGRAGDPGAWIAL